MNFISRRDLIKAISATTLAGGFPMIARSAELLPKDDRRVVVIGGGFGGSIVAKTIRQIDPSIEVVLVEREKLYTACPMSNLVLSGLRKIEQNQVTHEKLQSTYGVKIVYGEVTAIDADNKTVVLSNGTLSYDKLVVSPGIDFIPGAIEGYDLTKTPELMPHAWKAGAQTTLLRKQLEAMADGGTFVMSIPEAPYRCAPAPYERICQVAWYLKNNKPKSRIIVLDANSDVVSKSKLFHGVWKKNYAGIIDYRGGQKVIKVSPEKLTVHTSAGEVKGDVVNLIPPQHAGAIAHLAGLVNDDKRWCNVNQTTYESTKVEDIHIIGDACTAGTMLKSAFSAHSHGKVCALNLVATMNEKKLFDPSLANVIYSFTSDKEAVSLAAVYRVADGKTIEVENAGGASAAPSEQEGKYALAWMSNIMAEISS